MIKYARVTQVNGNDFYVTFLGETEQSQMVYKRLATYTPKVGDMVAIFEDARGKKIVIGEVI